MSQQTNTCCPCDPVHSIKLPLTDVTLGIDASALGGLGGGLSREEIVQIVREELQGQSGGSRNIWESDWFGIAANQVIQFEHNLGLEAPWKATPKLVCRVEKAAAGWEVGDIVFCDGSNVIGATSGQETGWAIAMTATTAHVTFGNAVAIMYNKKSGGMAALAKTDVKCKLIIEY